MQQSLSAGAPNENALSVNCRIETVQREIRLIVACWQTAPKSWSGSSECMITER